MDFPTLDDIRLAAERVKGAVARTRTSESETLGKLLGARVALKFENLQFTASFKERGALNKLLSLTEDQRQRGIVAMSAGNHAQGVAYHAARLGIPATIVMPTFTPFVKIEHTQAHGATVVLEGNTLSEASAHARTLERERGLTFVHPYDDPLIVAGQGTAGLELMEDSPFPLDTVVVPIGGGGLISGIATAVKSLDPSVEVIGVQSALYPAMAQVMRGEPPRTGGDTIAEGIAVKEPGVLTAEIVRRRVDDILLVNEAAIEHAVIQLLSIEKTLVEGAGAAGLAALGAYPERFVGRRVGVVLSGGNIDQRLLASVIQRDLVRIGRMARLRIELSDAPGSLARVTGLIAKHGGNIIDVAHQRVFSQLPAKDTTLEVAVETMDARTLTALVKALRDESYVVAILDGPGRG